MKKFLQEVLSTYLTVAMVQYFYIDNIFLFRETLYTNESGDNYFTEIRVICNN